MKKMTSLLDSERVRPGAILKGCLWLLGAAMLASASTQSASAAEPFTGGTIYIIDNDAYNLGWAKNPIEGQWRNATFTYWDWGSCEEPVFDADANAFVKNEDGTFKYATRWLDHGPGGYNMRPTFDFSGYAVTIDGVDYPVYKYTVPITTFRKYDVYEEYTDIDGNKDLIKVDTKLIPVDYKLTHENSSTGHQDWEQADGNCYLFFGDNCGVFKRNYDPATDPDTKLLTAEELAAHNGKTYKIYFNGNGDRQYYIDTRFDDNGNPIETTWCPEWEADCRATHIHLWGPGGDFTPWALGKPCTRMVQVVNPDSDKPQDVYFWTGEGWKKNVYEFEFTYFGGDPEGIIFRQDEVKGYPFAGNTARRCPYCDAVKSKDMTDLEKNYHNYYRCDYSTFIDGAFYQYSPIGSVMPISNPVMTTDYKKFDWDAPATGGDLVDHSIWFIDTDNWIYLTEGDTPDEVCYFHVTDPSGRVEMDSYTFYESIGQDLYYGRPPRPDSYDNDYLAELGIEVVYQPASYNGLHGTLMGVTYTCQAGVSFEEGSLTDEDGDQYWGYILTNKDGNGVTASYLDPNSGSNMPSNYINMILVTPYVSSTWPWGVPMSDMRIDYSEKGVRFVKMNGKWYPMYHIHFACDPSLDKFQLNNYGTPRTSAWMPIVEDGVYYYAGRDIACPIRQFSDLTDITEPVATRDKMPVDDDAEQGRDIYVNLGANQILQKDLWRVPYAIAYKRDSYSNPHGNPYDPGFYNDWTGEYYESDFHNFYNKNLNIPRLPKHVKYTADDYKDSDLKKFEMDSVPGHPGMWKFHVDDVSKYNDFMCWYYAYKKEAVLKDCSEEDWYAYLDKIGYPHPEEDGNHDTYEANDKDGVKVATRNWAFASYGNRKVKILTNENDEFLDEDGNSTYVEVSYNDYNTYAAQNSIDGWVYIKEYHGTDDGPDCPLATVDKIDKYYKVKLDPNFDYLNTEDYKLPGNAESDSEFFYATNHDHASTFFPEGSATPWSEGWRAANIIAVPDHFVYQMLDYYLESESPEEIIPEYNSNKCWTNMCAFPASRSRWHDATVWDKYVYDLGEDCLHQSYMTPEDYLKLPKIPSADIPAVYLVGNKAVMGNDNYNLREAVRVENEGGAFFHDFSNVTPDMPAEFKVSIVNVDTYASAAEKSTFEGYYNYQRGWATFNLGLIGPYKNPESDGYDGWYTDHVQNGSPTRKVRVNCDETYDFTTFSQYSWRIEVDETGSWRGMKPGNYYFVIDFIPGEETITLLDFDPHPHPVFSGIEVRKIKLDPSSAAILYDGDGIPGHQHNPGTAMHNEANVLKAGIDIGDTAAATIAEREYEVLYTIFIDDKLAYYTDKITHEGKPETIVADFLNLSEDTEIAVRGRYHDLKTNRYFSSKLRNEKISNILAELPTLVVTNSDALPQEIKFYWKNTEDHNEGFCLGAAAKIDFAKEATEASEGAPSHDEYVMLPGYEVTNVVYNNTELPLSAVSAPIIHKGHQIVTEFGWQHYLGSNPGVSEVAEEGEEATEDSPWTPSENPADMADWSKVALETGSMPILLHGLTEFKEAGEVNGSSVRASINLLASYPFIVRDFGKDIQVLPEEFDIVTGKGNNDETKDEQENTEPSAAPRRAEDTSVIDPTVLPADLTKYSIMMVNRPTPVSLAPANLVVSAIQNVSTDNEVLPDPEYYNIQGMRVGADNLQPGIYIERRGTKARKIIVR